MKGGKIAGLFLIICAILFFINDFSHKNTGSFDTKRIKIENYLLFKSINIDRILSKVAGFKDDIKIYFASKKNLLNENIKLNKNIENLQDIIFINGILSRERSKSIYDEFDFNQIDISHNKKSFYGVAMNSEGLIEKGDLIVNHCGIIGKVSHVGSEMAIIMMSNHPKFYLPVRSAINKENIGLLSLGKKEIIEIKNKKNLFVGEQFITLRYKNKIPEGISIGKISSNKNGDAFVDVGSCGDLNFGFVLKYKK